MNVDHGTPRRSLPIYQVVLEGKAIGETQLEIADPPMGVVGGKVLFSIPDSPYTFFKNYCMNHGIEINEHEETSEFISTQNIPELKVYRSDCIEIAALVGASILGFRDDGYHVTILVIPYPFYAEEFPHHCEAYEKRFCDSTD